MVYVAIDGDDIGQKIAYCYLQNSPAALKEVNDTVQDKVKRLSLLLEGFGFKIIFCAADGVTAYSDSMPMDYSKMSGNISKLAGSDITFSVGVGENLRESYIALQMAKSKGKAQIYNFSDIDKNV
jgi:hypothetical protein